MSSKDFLIGVEREQALAGPSPLPPFTLPTKSQRHVLGGPLKGGWTLLGGDRTKGDVMGKKEVGFWI